MTSPAPFEKESAPGLVPASAPNNGPLPTLVQIGDIHCTETTVYTPSGEAPIADVFWSTTDMTQTQTKTPVWAIVMCLLFVGFCGIGLLFLMAKETVTVGNVQVTVRGPGLLHTNNAPGTWALANDLEGRVAHARLLTKLARERRT